jgi:hypothetical protein
VDWIHLAQNREHWGCCEHGNKLSGYIEGMGFLVLCGITFNIYRGNKFKTS